MHKKILLADDSITIQKVIRLTLRTSGHEIIECKSEEEVYSYLQKNVTDIIMLDFTLSDNLDGYELAQKIYSYAPEVQILMLYGTFDTVNEDKLLQHNVNKYVVKPFESSAIVESINQLIELGPSSQNQKEQNVVERKNDNINNIDNKVTEIEDDNNWEIQTNVETANEEMNEELNEDVIDQKKAETGSDQMVAQESFKNEVEEWGVNLPDEKKNLELGDVADKNDQLSKMDLPEIDHQEIKEDDVTQLNIQTPEDLWASDPVLGPDSDFKSIENEVNNVSATEEVEDDQNSIKNIPVVEDATINVSEDLIIQQIEPILKEFIENHAKEMIEKVIWDVVPDIAQRMLSEEIDKIKKRIDSKQQSL